MRPVRRQASPRPQDFANYRDALPHLVHRFGLYCSYCERRIATQLAVEHIQPKGLDKYAQLVGRWENYLLACVNCNSTKRTKDVDPAHVLLPDRDNAFLAFSYRMDGTVDPAAVPAPVQAMASRTLAVVGLDKRNSVALDDNGKLVALDRMSQRMEAWLAAEGAKSDVDSNPGNPAVRRMAVRVALGYGFFSIWMTVFADDTSMRDDLIDAFAGTRESGCFDPDTTQPISPAPNPDALPYGGKA